MTSPQGYIFYNSSESIKTLDQNKVCLQNASQFPARIYSKNAFNPSRCYPNQSMTCQSYPRDTSIDYTLHKDRDTHPDHFSRFTYDWMPENGYGIANHPGRYNTPAAFRWMTSAQPLGMAPERFYHGDHVDPNYTSSEAYNAAFQARQNR